MSEENLDCIIDMVEKLPPSEVEAMLRSYDIDTLGLFFAIHLNPSSLVIEATYQRATQMGGQDWQIEPQSIPVPEISQPIHIILA